MTIEEREIAVIWSSALSLDLHNGNLLALAAIIGLVLLKYRVRKQ